MTIQEDAYPLPRATGEKVAETKRLDEQHEMFKLLLGGITVAPLSANVASALDIGCGTGIWSRQFAELHPTTQVLGVDLMPPAFTRSGDYSAPPNCKFVQANIEGDWTFASGQRFDFIFARLLILALRDWPQLFSRIYEHLTPGGMFELYEAIVVIGADDGATGKDSAIIRWWEEMHSYLASRGLDPDAPERFTGMLQQTGFHVTYDQPVRLYLDPGVGASHDPVNGATVAEHISSDLRALVRNATEKMLSSPAQRALTAEALDDMARNSGTRGYYMLHSHRVAQKPV